MFVCFNQHTNAVGFNHVGPAVLCGCRCAGQCHQCRIVDTVAPEACITSTNRCIVQHRPCLRRLPHHRRQPSPAAWIRACSRPNDATRSQRHHPTLSAAVTMHVHRCSCAQPPPMMSLAAGSPGFCRPQRGAQTLSAGLRNPDWILWWFEKPTSARGDPNSILCAINPNSIVFGGNPNSILCAKNPTLIFGAENPTLSFTRIEFRFCQRKGSNLDLLDAHVGALRYDALEWPQRHRVVAAHA